MKRADTPFFDQVTDEGEVSFECKAVFPTATYTGHASIITGNYPEKHGMVGNRFWDRKNKCVRKFGNIDSAKCIESTTIFELLPFRTCAICNPLTKGASLVIDKKIFDQEDYQTLNRAIYNQLKKTLSPDIDFYMVNFKGIDKLGETYGPDSGEYSNALKEVDRLLSELKNQIQSDFVFIITADHGMTTVETNINLERVLEEEGFQARCPASHRCCHVYADSNLEELENHLRRFSFIDKIFNSAEIEKLHLNHDRSGDLVVSSKIGVEFGEDMLKGSHGGTTRVEKTVPFLFYDSGNHFAEKISLKSINLIDICPTVLDIFDIKTNSKFQGSSLFKNI